MKVAYVFATDMAASYKLATMILPQLEAGTHGVEVLGMFFFDDNLYLLSEGNPAGERLARLAADRGMLLMVCDQCAVSRGLAEGTLDQCGTGEVKARGLVAGVQAGCFPQLYAALGPAAPDQVITL
ncbi:MAG: SaoD/DsrE family protein [Pseudomonadota bacterium]